MALLSSMMRVDALTRGRAGAVDAWFSGRQSGRWLTQSTRVAATRDAAKTRDELTELHRSGTVTDAELEQLRARLRV